MELVSTIDVNRDGAVSLNEFLSFLLRVGALLRSGFAHF
jgi:hypothetical protein